MIRIQYKTPYESGKLQVPVDSLSMVDYAINKKYQSIGAAPCIKLDPFSNSINVEVFESRNTKNRTKLSHYFRLDDPVLTGTYKSRGIRALFIKLKNY